jgi:uncharacterized protein YggU (UPF0235/DUF167 family)
MILNILKNQKIFGTPKTRKFFSVKVKPNSPKSEFDESLSFAYLKASPEKNKANIELIKLLAKHFKVSSTRIRIIKGLTSREKMVEIK